MNILESLTLFLAGITLGAGAAAIIGLGRFILTERDQEYSKKYQEFLEQKYRVQNRLEKARGNENSN